MKYSISVLQILTNTFYSKMEMERQSFSCSAACFTFCATRQQSIFQKNNNNNKKIYNIL